MATAEVDQTKLTEMDSNEELNKSCLQEKSELESVLNQTMEATANLQELEKELKIGAEKGFKKSFIKKFIVEPPKRSIFVRMFSRSKKSEEQVAFEFKNKAFSFRAFPSGTEIKRKMMQQLATALAQYPKAIKRINVFNSALDNDFLNTICDCIEKGQLEHVQAMNLESNLLEEDSLIRLASILENDKYLKHLRELKLENQGKPVSSQAELAFDNALKVNTHVTKFNLTIRNKGLAMSIDKSVARNSDAVRKQRYDEKVKSGVKIEKKLNVMQIQLEKIAKNDKEVTEIDLSGDMLFLSLHKNEVVEFGQSLGKNTRLKKLKLNNLNLDKDFAIALAESIRRNSSIEEIDLENNKIPSEGVEAICCALVENKTIEKLLLSNQKGSAVSTQAEEAIFQAILQNKVLCKLGLQFKTRHIQDKLDAHFSSNREIRRVSSPRKVSEPPKSKFVKKNRVQERIERLIVNDEGELAETVFEYTEDQVFISMKQDLKEKLMSLIAENKSIKVLKLVRVDVNDMLVNILSESLKKNETLEEVNLEGNEISGDGIQKLCESLRDNSTLKKLYLKHQKGSKTLSSSAETVISEIVEENQTISKLGLTFRNTQAQNVMEKALLRNSKTFS